MDPVMHVRRILTGFLLTLVSLRSLAVEIVGLTVTPHQQSPEMRYRKPASPERGARVELFLRNNRSQPLSLGPESPVLFDGIHPNDLLRQGAWAWHDTPSAQTNTALVLPEGALTVWRFNTRTTPWGAGSQHDLRIGTDNPAPLALDLKQPSTWISAITFLGPADSVVPNSVVVHVMNDSDAPLTLRRLRLWTPDGPSSHRVLHPQTWRTNLSGFPTSRTIPAHEKGGFRLHTGPLPLTYAAVEVETASMDGTTHSLWAHLRIKREVFDIGGGWVASGLGGSNSLHVEPYLKTLRRMHINAGMHDHVSGYSDTPLFQRYPLKYMNRLQPFDRYDTSEILPRIHAVEFLGEPQFGGGRPVPPQQVWNAFAPYESTRLPTSVTHSEERIWREYAGLSDYPHYDAYRVCAPAPDAWGQYDRWQGQRIRWGAPLETIGDMTRSLRDLNRPKPIAYWSQGAHDGWDRYGGRHRTSPTPDELRAQAYHALAQRITSLYWFNLSLKSLVKFPDLIDPITRVNREIRLMEDLLLEGDAFEYRRESSKEGPSWDLSSIVGPRGALLFVNDLAYSPDHQEKVFRFIPREGAWIFRLPADLASSTEVFRLDAEGPHPVDFSQTATGLRIRDRISVVGVYVVSREPGLLEVMRGRHAGLLRFEEEFQFDPAKTPRDLEILREQTRTNGPKP